MWIVYAVLAAVLWGLNYSVAERVLKDISPVTLLALEMLGGGILFLGLSFILNLKSDYINIFRSGSTFTWVTLEVITVIIANFFIVYSIQAKNATVAGLVELMYPIFTIMFSWFLFKYYHVNLPVLVGGSLIMIGVTIISFA